MGQEASVPRHDDNAANLGGATGNNSHLAPPQEGGSSTNVGTSPRNNGTGSANSSTPTATTTSRVGMSERAPGIIPYRQPQQQQHSQMITTTTTTQPSQQSTVSSPTTASQSIMSRAGITSMMQRIGGVASSSNNITRGGLSNGISKAAAATHNGGAELSPESKARQQAMSMQKKQQQQQNTTYNVNMMYNTGQPSNNRSSSPTNNISRGISNIQLSPKRTTHQQQHSSPPPSPRAITLKQMSNNDEEDWQKAWEEDSEEESDDDDEHDDGVVEHDRVSVDKEGTPSLASSVGATAGSERDNNRILPNVPNLVVGKQQQQLSKPSITTTAASIIQQGGIPPIPPYTPANNQQLETLKTPIIQYKPIQPKSHFTSPIIPSIQAGYTQDEIDEENRLVQTANEILGTDSEYVRGQTKAKGGEMVVEGDNDDQEVIERPCCEMFEPALRVLGRGSFGRVSLFICLASLACFHFQISFTHTKQHHTPHGY